jgi:hypothetical protein
MVDLLAEKVAAMLVQWSVEMMAGQMDKMMAAHLAGL